MREKTAEFYHARDTQLTSNPPLRPRDFTVYVSVAFPTQGTTRKGWEDERIHQTVSGIEGAIEHVGIVARTRRAAAIVLSVLHVLLNPATAGRVGRRLTATNCRYEIRRSVSIRSDASHQDD